MKKSCLLRGSRSSVGSGGAGGALRRRRRCGGGALRLRPPAALQRLRLRRRQKNIGNNQLYRKRECVAVLCEDGDVLRIRRGWGCVADQARMEMCCGSGEDGGSSSSSWGPIMRVCSGSGEPEDYFSIQKYRQTLNRRIC